MSFGPNGGAMEPITGSWPKARWSTNSRRFSGSWEWVRGSNSKAVLTQTTTHKTTQNYNVSNIRNTNACVTTVCYAGDGDWIRADFLPPDTNRMLRFGFFLRIFVIPMRNEGTWMHMHSYGCVARYIWIDRCMQTHTDAYGCV